MSGILGILGISGGETVRTPHRQIYKDMVLEHVVQFAEQAGGCVLVTLVARSGSSPRPVGSQMAVSRAGAAVGFISGGCAEAALIAEALQTLEAGMPRVVRYGVGSPYMDVVLPCGSSIDVLFSPIATEADLAAIRHACNDYKARRLFSLSLPIGSPPNEGAAPRVGMPANGLTANCMTVHSVPSIAHSPCYESEGAPQHSLAGAFEELETFKMQGAEAGAACGIAARAYVRRYVPQPRLVVAGRGPIVPMLANLAAAMGYEVFAASPDADMLSNTPFSGTLHMKSPIGYETQIAAWLDSHSAFVTTFHDHEWEPSLLTAALKTNAFYVGALGSRKTHSLRSDLLAREHGLSARDIARIDGPAGLDIGAVGPNEIGLSIMAAVVSAYRQRGTLSVQENCKANVLERGHQFIAAEAGEGEPVC